MVRLLVKYKVKADRIADNERLIRAVYSALHELNDPDVHYATFKMQDGCTYVHLAMFPSAEKQKALTELAAFEAFQAELKDRCETPPDAQPPTEIGSYNVGLE